MTRLFPFLGALMILAASAGPTGANVPDPSRVRVRWSNPATPCGFLFGPSVMADLLTAYITLRDLFDQPVPGCTTSVSPVPIAGTLAYCNCCPGAGAVFGVSDTTGAVVTVMGSSIGGRGDLRAEVTAHCAGKVGITSTTVQFTSQDLIGSCATPDIFSLAVWAGGLPPSYVVFSDYTCDGVVDIFDLGVWAGGLLTTCVCP